MGEFHEEFSDMWPADGLQFSLFSLATVRKKLNDKEREEFERFLDFIGGSNSYFNELRDKEVNFEKEIILDLDDNRVYIRFKDGKIVSWSSWL